MHMKIHVRDGDLHLIDLRTRMPFKYGIATMTTPPHAFARLRVEVDGQVATGMAADHLPPKWFTKDPNRSLEDEIDEMARVVEQALGLVVGLGGETPFDVWHELWERQAAWGREQALPPLLTHFGTSLMERAVIEAFCRARGQPFHQLLRTGQLGIRLGDIHASLASRSPAEFLPEQPLARIVARHTVGLADPLGDADIPVSERLDDGLPQALEACIHTYGLQHFKIKVSGTLDRDLERLRRIADLLAAHAPTSYAFSLDGNEQFHALDEFQAFWARLTDTAELRPFFGHLLFVEQPFHRATALDPDAVGGLKDWPGPPLIIDESDADLDSLPRALALGYAGTSHKNCKGVFKGIANACLLAQRRRQPGMAAIMSGEDLVNIGPVALLQDLASCAALGVASVERNGHHYFAGLSMFPPAIQQQVLQAHGDLYQATAKGWPALRVEAGSLAVGSVNRAPFGVGPVIDVDRLPTLAAWRKLHPGRMSNPAR